MHRIPCEADLSSDDDEIWARAVSRCTMAATPQCTEAKACVFDGSCFDVVQVEPGEDKNKALELLVVDLQTKIDELQVKQNTLFAALEYRLYGTERLYTQALKKGNESNAFAYNILRSELKSLIQDLNNEPDKARLGRLKRNIHILK
nr:hypothetical protein [uncultured Acinetobacter sp.]